MSRFAALALTAAVLLVGCPLPQPLPEYAGGAVTPPRIVVDDSTASNQIAYPGTIVPVPVGCATHPAFPLDAQIRDANPNLEIIQVRWFVNYDPSNTNLMAPLYPETVGPAPSDPTLRDIAAFTFMPYDYPSVGGGASEAPGGVHVVELVVSNNFNPVTSQPWNPDDPPPNPLPNRSPAPGFEVQVYRWVFLNVSPSATACAAGDTLCATCPATP